MKLLQQLTALKKKKNVGGLGQGPNDGKGAGLHQGF